MNAASIGISLATQLYFHDGPVFENVLLNLEVGVL